MGAVPGGGRTCGSCFAHGFNVKAKLLWGGKRFPLDVIFFPLAVAFGGLFGDLEGVRSATCIGLSFLGRSWLADPISTWM